MADGLNLNIAVNLDAARLRAEAKSVLNEARALERAFGAISPVGLTRGEAEFRKASRTIKEVEERVRTAKGELTGLSHQAQLTAKRFLIYRVVSSIIFTITKALQDATRTFIAFDLELNKARQILNPLLSDFDTFTKTIFELANAYGVTIAEVQKAQETFIRQGKNAAETNELTRASLALASAAAFDFAQSTEAVTSAINQFSAEGITAIQVADKLVKVANNFAVEAGDLDQALRRSGNAAQTVGVSFDNLVGFVTAAQESTRRGGEVIGTALRTIFTRIFRAPSIQLMEELGIATRDATGDFRKADDLLKDLSKRFATLSRTQQISIASTIAGQRQISTLLAVLNNFARAEEASTTALLSGGEAARLTRIRQEALSVQLQKITNQFVEFGNALTKTFAGPIVEDIKAATGVFLGFLKGIGEGVGALGGTAGGLIQTFKILGLILLAQASAASASGGKLSTLRKEITGTADDLRTLEKAGKKVTFFDKAGAFLGKSDRVAAEAALVKLNVQQLETSRQKTALEFQVAHAKKIQYDLDVSSERIKANAKANEQELLEISKTKAAIQKSLNTEEELASRIQSKNEHERLRITTERLAKQRKIHEEELKTAQDSLKTIIGSKGAGRTAQGLVGGLQVDRDRKKTAEQLVVLEGEIASLRERQAELGKINSQSAETEAQKIKTIANLRQQELEKVGEANRIRSALMKNATEEEKRLLTIAEKADVALLKNSEQLLRAKQLELRNTETIANLEGKVAAIQQARLELQNILVERQRIQEGLAEAIISDEGKIAVLENEKIALIEREKVARDALTKSELALVEATEKEALARSNIGKTTFGQGLRKGIGIFALLSIFQVAQSAAKDFFDTTEQRSKSLEIAFEGVGSALTTALFVGGPLGVALAAIQGIIAVVKIVKNEAFDFKRAIEESEKATDKLNESISATQSTFKGLLDVARKFSTEAISTELFRQLQEKLKDVDKAFTNLSQGEINGVKQRIEDIIQSGQSIDVVSKELAKVEKEARQLNALNAVKKGAIINTDQNKEAIQSMDELQAKIAELQAKRDELLRGGNALDVFGEGVNSLTLAETEADNLGKELEALRAEEKATAEQFAKLGPTIITTFTEALKPELTFAENLERLGPTFVTLAKQSGKLGEIQGIYNQIALGISKAKVEGIEFSSITQQQVAVSDQLGDAIENRTDQITAFTQALQNNADTAGKSATALFTLNEGAITGGPAFGAFFQELARLDGAVDPRLIGQFFQEIQNGTRAVRTYVSAQGEISFQIEGMSTIITKETGPAFAFLNDLLNKSGKFSQALVTDLINLRDAGIAAEVVNNALAKSYASMSNQINRTSDALSDIRTALGKVQQASTEVAQSFPTLALQQSDEALDQMLITSSALSTGLNKVIGTFDQLEQTSDRLNVQLGQTLQASLLEGGISADEFSAKMAVATSTVDEMVQLTDSLSDSVADFSTTATDSAGIARLTSQAQSLAKEFTQLQKLGSAAIGLDAIKDKLLNSATDVTGEQEVEIQKFIDTLSSSFDVSSFDFGGGKEKLAQNIDTLLSTLTNKVRTDVEPEAAAAGRKMADALVQGMKAEQGEGGDAIIRSITTLLTQAGAKVTEELKPAIEELQQSFRNLAKESQASLEFIVDSAKANVSNLNQLLSKGINIPETVISRILVHDFERAEDASKVMVSNIIDQLKVLGKRESFVRQQIVNLGEISQDDVVKQQQRIALEQQLLEINEQQRVKEAQKLAIQAQQNTQVAQLNQALTIAITTFSKGIVDVVNAQNAVADAEINLFGKRMTFIDQENQTFAQRASLAQLESQTFENIRRQITGLPATNISELGDKIVELTRDKISTEALDTAAAAGIQANIDRLQNQLDLEKAVAEGRVSGLEKELNILNEQQKAVRNLALEFVKGTQQQQEEILKGAQLVDTFFGNIKPNDLKTGAVKDSVSQFLRQSDDQTRSIVIGQLEQLKAVGGEIAPGVGAAEILNQLSDAVAGALFKDPVIEIAGRQEELQKKIVEAQIRANQVALVQLRVEEAQLRAAEATLNAVAKSTTDRTGATQAPVDVASLSASRESLSQTINELIDQQSQEIGSVKDLLKVNDAQNVSNKEMLKGFEGMTIGAGESALTAEELQNKLQELREALRVAKDGVADAEKQFSDALSAVGVALVNSTKAQSEFNLGLQLATRSNLDAVGGFATFRDEMNFLTSAFGQSITALQRVGAAETDIAELRKRLAQEQLSILQDQINQFKSQAEALLTGGTSPTDIVRQSQAANIAANLANTIANPDDLARAILQLGPQFGKDAAEGLKNALPGETFAGGQSGQAVLDTILNAVGGTTQDNVNIKSLEEEAAAQRKIIAENSIAGLEQARQQSIAAFGQLQAAQEALLEARAQKDLAQMQLDALKNNADSTNSILERVADGIDRMDAKLDLSQFSGFGGVSTVNAAGGTLSQSEARGLLSAASREKRLMPTGANLGVFNTSETVLTRRQASMLKRSTNVPFAADGFGFSTADTTAIINTLNAISQKLDAVVRDDGVRTIELSVNGERRVRVEGVAGLQTALQDIISDRTADLFSREEGQAISQFIEMLVQKLRINGLQLPQTSTGA